MILVVGGMASGKRSYVQGLGYERGEMADAVLDQRPVIYNLQDLVAASPENGLMLLPSLLEKEVVICNEVGSGVIPVDNKKRAAREATGRLCILLAQQAERVVRLVAGIPSVMKE